MADVRLIEAVVPSEDGFYCILGLKNGTHFSQTHHKTIEEVEAEADRLVALGVDVFFVISGYLISSIIYSNLKNQSFSFRDFYFRRIRRIFPALLIVLVSTYVFGWFFLTPREYETLNQQIASGAGFISNFLFWRQSGYFDIAADKKPLLHLRSLAIEEQFYIFWPLLVWIFWKLRSNLLLVVIGFAISSFCLNVYKIGVDPIGDFYSPQTRVWEFEALQ